MAHVLLQNQAKVKDQLRPACTLQLGKSFCQVVSISFRDGTTRSGSASASIRLIDGFLAIKRGVIIALIGPLTIDLEEAKHGLEAAEVLQSALKSCLTLNVLLQLELLLNLGDGAPDLHQLLELGDVGATFGEILNFCLNFLITA